MYNDPHEILLLVRSRSERGARRAIQKEFLEEARKANESICDDNRQKRQLWILKWANQLQRLRIQISFVPVNKATPQKIENLKGCCSTSGI